MEGGVNISGATFDREAGVRAFQKFTPYYGFNFTFIPEDKKKPGITINLNVVDNGFLEINRDTIINYQLRGHELHMESHLYVQIRKTRLFANLGPGISYLPVKIVDYPEVSVLPEFNDRNINQVYVNMAGGAGVTQSIGIFDLTFFGNISYQISDVYRREFWDSNVVSIKGGLRLQVGF